MSSIKFFHIIRSLARGLFSLILMLAIGLEVYACAGQRSLRKEVRQTPRDPKSGIVLGTEAISLDPPGTRDKPTTACLLLHGFCGSRKDFADLGQRLAAAGYHVRLARLAGHGTSEEDLAQQTPESMRNAVDREYRELRRHYQAIDVIGFSMGGTLATLLAAHEDVHRLVLVSPFYGLIYHWYDVLPPETWNAMFSPMVPYVLKIKALEPVNRRESIPFLYSYHCIPTHGVLTIMALKQQALRLQTLQAVHCPTLMLVAKGDRVIDAGKARYAVEHLRSSKKLSHWFSKRSNHILLWEDEGQEAKDEIIKFLEN